MITAETFNVLETGEQIRVAMRHDTMIGHRSEGPRSMHLYVVADFYVEVVFTTKRKSILSVLATQDEAILEPYLQQIDLTELFI